MAWIFSMLSSLGTEPRPAGDDRVKTLSGFVAVSWSIALYKSHGKGKSAVKAREGQFIGRRWSPSD
jgi:hypothetical protein